MANLVPDFSGIQTNTSGALRNLLDANRAVTESYMAPVDRLERYAKEAEAKRILDEDRAFRLEDRALRLEDRNIAMKDKELAKQKEANTADALNLIQNKDMFVKNKIDNEINLARAGIENLSGQEKIDAQNQLDNYIKSGTGLSGNQWISNTSNATNVDANVLYSARLNAEKLANDRADRAEDLKWKEKEYNLNLMKAQMSGEPKYKGQVYTDPKTGAFVTTRSAAEERALAEAGWMFGKNPNAGKEMSGVSGGGLKEEKDYTSGYKKLEERVLDYGSIDDSTALDNLQMLKMFKINPNDVESMITKIEANTAFDKTLNYNDMNKYGHQIKSSDGKLLPLGDAVRLAKEEGYITVLEKGKPVLYKPTENKAIEEKLKEVEKPLPKSTENISQKDIAPARKTEDEVLNDIRSKIAKTINDRKLSDIDYYGEGTGPSVPSIRNELLAKKENESKIKDEYESLNSKFKNDVSYDDYISNKSIYDKLYNLDYKNK